MKSWLKWPLLEGQVKAVEAIFQKLVGLTITSFSGAIMANIISGSINVFGGLAGGLLRKKSFRVGAFQIFLSFLFGFIASVMVISKFWAFSYKDADLGIVVFVGTLSIIPGAVIDHMLSVHRLTFRRWLGVLIFLASGYVIIGLPSLGQLQKLPVWLWLAVLHAVLATANEFIAQIQRLVDPMVVNFWAGLSRLIFSFVGLTIIYKIEGIEKLLLSFVIICAVMGVFSTSVNVIKLLAYKDGGNIALKKLVTQSTLVVSGIVYGIIFFQEPLNIEKVVGIIGYIIAFAITDNQVWDSLSCKSLNFTG